MLSEKDKALQRRKALEEKHREAAAAQALSDPQAKKRDLKMQSKAEQHLQATLLKQEQMKKDQENLESMQQKINA